MTELLTKEKQFLKLNEELDRIAKSAATAQEAAAPKADNRSHTFQRLKGPTTLLRKQGGGDGIVEIIDATNIRTNATTVNKAMGGESYRSSIRQPASSSLRGASTHSSNVPQYLQKPRCSSQTYNRVSSSRVLPSNHSAFTVKYRNPKFLESPSLEVLVKEERSSLRCQNMESNIGSPTAVATEESISSGRCSHTSNQAVSSKKNISSEGVIKFLKSKIVILEEDHGRLSEEMATQKGLLDKALDNTKSLEQQREYTKTKNTSLAEQLSKTEKLLQEANKHLKESSIEQNEQQKELDATKRELKLIMQSNTNLEKRLFRANEDLESTRNTMGLMKTAERDQNETNRRELESKEIQIKSLKKQRANLLNAYKKQLFLIDNLKKQNILLEQSKMLDFGEKEFAKVIDWNVKS